MRKLQFSEHALPLCPQDKTLRDLTERLARSRIHACFRRALSSQYERAEARAIADALYQLRVDTFESP